MTTSELDMQLLTLKQVDPGLQTMALTPIDRLLRTESVLAVVPVIADISYRRDELVGRTASPESLGVLVRRHRVDDSLTKAIGRILRPRPGRGGRYRPATVSEAVFAT
jgi:hypothetical protein